METSLPTPTTARVELLIYQRVPMNVPYDFRGNAILGWVPGFGSMDFRGVFGVFGRDLGGISWGSTMDLTRISREDMDFTVKRCDCTTNVMLEEVWF